MNRALICRLLGWIALLIGAAMAMSLPWVAPAFGQVESFDVRSLVAILGAMAACGFVGSLLIYFGRGAKGATLYRREAIAVVGLSWILATILGALPFWFSGTSVGRDAQGRPIPMDGFDGIFESASGFTGTGATVLTNLEDPELVPRAVLFWRSETHFLGGLGIMVLFVAILGLGSAGKTLLLTEMPGPAAESEHARSQRAAWVFAAIFIGLTTILTGLLTIEGLSLFDALCHAFGTIATGGFSTYNKSVEHFHSVSVEMTITLFMFAACTNFTLLYYVVILRPSKLLADVEFRTYTAIVIVATALVVGFGLSNGEFANLGGAVRYGLFQVVSIITNTGFGTANFNTWHSLSRGLLLVLMFVGGCAGSTSCSIKVIRYVLLFKVFGLEIEQVFHPNVVRHVRVGGNPLPDPEVRKDVAVYFGLILMIFLTAWLTLMAIEPNESWVEAGYSPRDKLVDCGSAVAATLNGVGPGLGIVGETENYAHFHGPSKFVLSWMMLLGRLEVFIVLILFLPGFWRGKW